MLRQVHLQKSAVFSTLLTSRPKRFNGSFNGHISMPVYTSRRMNHNMQCILCIVSSLYHMIPLMRSLLWVSIWTFGVRTSISSKGTVEVFSLRKLIPLETDSPNKIHSMPLKELKSLQWRHSAVLSAAHSIELGAFIEYSMQRCIEQGLFVNQILTCGEFHFAAFKLNISMSFSESHLNEPVSEPQSFRYPVIIFVVKNFHDPILPIPKLLFLPKICDRKLKFSNWRTLPGCRSTRSHQKEFAVALSIIRDAWSSKWCKKGKTQMLILLTYYTKQDSESISIISDIGRRPL